MVEHIFCFCVCSFYRKIDTKSHFHFGAKNKLWLVCQHNVSIICSFWLRKIDDSHRRARLGSRVNLFVRENNETMKQWYYSWSLEPKQTRSVSLRNILKTFRLAIRCWKEVPCPERLSPMFKDRLIFVSLRFGTKTCWCISQYIGSSDLLPLSMSYGVIYTCLDHRIQGQT